MYLAGALSKQTRVAGRRTAPLEHEEVASLACGTDPIFSHEGSAGRKSLVEPVPDLAFIL
jgi:hypothetical protein